MIPFVFLLLTSYGLIAIDCGKIDLQEEVEHVRLKTVRILTVGATLIYQHLLMHRDHISHINTNLELLHFLQSTLSLKHGVLADIR